jgi:hypothetical protein
VSETPPTNPIGLASAIVPAVPAAILLARFAFHAGDALSLLITIVMVVALLSYIAWFIIAVPVILALRKTPLYHPIPIVLAGAICGFLIIPAGRLVFNWYRPPEAEVWWSVASGIIAAVLFLIIARVPFRRPAKQGVRDATIQK